MTGGIRPAEHDSAGPGRLKMRGDLTLELALEIGAAGVPAFPIAISLGAMAVGGYTCVALNRDGRWPAHAGRGLASS